MSTVAKLLALLCVAPLGCYAPHPPSGSYLCTSTDAGEVGLCPSGLTCVYGQCVKQSSDAVFKLSVSVIDPMPKMGKSLSLTVNEHQPFEVEIKALDATGNLVTDFNGAVSLSSTWGDVRVCATSTSCPRSDGAPTIPLAAGVGHAYVTLNRETTSPQSAILRASFAEAVGTSGDLALTVNSPVFVRDASPIVAPLTDTSGGWGFADLTAGAPYVVESAGRYDLFFLAVVSSGQKQVSAIGLATSSDGKTFAPASAATVQSADDADASAIGAPAAVFDSSGVQLYYPKSRAEIPVAMGTTTTSTPFAFRSFVTQGASSPTGAFSSAAASIQLPADCPYCTAVDTPSLVADPTPALNGGGPDAQILYFSSLLPTTTTSMGVTTTTYPMSIVRGYAGDGQTFVVDPSPLIKSTTNESVLFAPRVLVDGSVYKMWYSYASAADVNASDVPAPCGGTYRVGYATSSDGYFWVRSPRNFGPANPKSGGTQPAMAVASSGWDAGNSVLVGSVMPVDTQDPGSGIVLYYGVFNQAQSAVTACASNGIGRAVRP